MIDLYAAPTTNGLRARIMLEESALPYTLNVVDLAKGEHKTPDFLKMNPMAMIPVIVDHDGPGGQPVTMAQSMGILVYLAQKSGKFMPKEPAAQPLFWESLMTVATDMGPTLGTVFAIGRSENPHKPTQDMFGARVTEYLRVWDAALARRPYCAGDEVTIVDFGLYPACYRCRAVTPELAEGFDNLARWEAEIGARPGVRKGLDFG